METSADARRLRHDCDDCSPQANPGQQRTTPEPRPTTHRTLRPGDRPCPPGARGGGHPAPRRGRPAVGPVIHDGACDTLGFLVPPGTADGWDMPGSACTQTSGRGLRIPAEPPVTGSGWLLPPDDTDPVTDPEVLREALGEAARLIEAADNCAEPI